MELWGDYIQYSILTHLNVFNVDEEDDVEELIEMNIMNESLEFTKEKLDLVFTKFNLIAGFDYYSVFF